MARILGLGRLQKKLKRMPKLAEKEIRKAMEEGANEIVALAKSLVPVESGDLRDSIGWTWGTRPKYSQAIASVKTSNERFVITIYAGNSAVRYAHLVEFGTAPHINQGLFAGSQHPGTAPKPFFFVSYRALRKRVKGRVTRAITKSAKAAAAGR